MKGIVHPIDLLWRVWEAMVGPSGWRSLVGPLAFAITGIALLVYDHLNQRVTDLVFWLILLLIAAVFARMLETNRKQSRELEEQRLDELRDQATALPNRRQLESDLEAAAAASDGQRVLVLLELDGLGAYGDRFGATAGADLLRRSAQGLLTAMTPLGGAVYRVDTARLAALVPCDERPLSEVMLAATASQREQGPDAAIGRAYGEVAIPGEADDPEAAFQVAGQRLAAHRQRQHRSARRQAHAVLMAALDARHPELRHHLRFVVYRAISLARRLGLGAEELDDVALAAELQEVGLLSVPESVLEKESLGEEERAMVRSHTAVGGQIVGAASGLAPVAALVRSSAERYDGSGYPDGLAGEAIPLGSRIVAVAVGFAALVARRPYSQALSPADALAELRGCTGSQFDPRVVEALAAELAEEGLPTTGAAPA